ncbi:MAG: DALR domain-containing protein, partial [Anaerolineaceae bacterium]
SRSLGNLITIEEFLKTVSADTFRIMILNSSYRNPLTATDEVLAQSERAMDRLRSGLKPALPGSKTTSGESISALSRQMEQTKASFEESMDDDFNTAGALGCLFELVRAINTARSDNAIGAILAPAQDLLRELTGVFGLRLDGKEDDKTPADPFVDYLVELRTIIRKQKLYQLSDEIRDHLLQLKVTIEDSKEGSTWHWN